MQGCRDVTQLLATRASSPKPATVSSAVSSDCKRSNDKLARAQRKLRSPSSPNPAHRARQPPYRSRQLSLLRHGWRGALGIGIPPHLSIFHGKTRAGGLVFDLADAFKDALVLPLSFSVATRKKGDDPEKMFRAKLIEAFDDHKILAKAVDTVEAMLSAGEAAAGLKV